MARLDAILQQVGKYFQEVDAIDMSDQPMIQALLEHLPTDGIRPSDGLHLATELSATLEYLVHKYTLKRDAAKQGYDTAQGQVSHTVRLDIESLTGRKPSNDAVWQNVQMDENYVNQRKDYEELAAFVETLTQLRWVLNMRKDILFRFWQEDSEHA